MQFYKLSDGIPIIPQSRSTAIDPGAKLRCFFRALIQPTHHVHHVHTHYPAQCQPILNHSGSGSVVCTAPAVRLLTNTICKHQGKIAVDIEVLRAQTLHLNISPTVV